MVHGDDSGLVLPPRVAPVQVVVIPVSQHKEGVLEKASELCNRLSKIARVKMDDSDKTPGWKFSEYEMKGVPIRLEIGPKDIEKGQVVLVSCMPFEQEKISDVCFCCGRGSREDGLLGQSILKKYITTKP